MTDDGRRVAAVTGGTGAIGKAIAEGIAQDRAHEVVLVCRDPDKAERSCTITNETTGNPQRSQNAIPPLALVRVTNRHQRERQMIRR